MNPFLRKISRIFYLGITDDMPFEEVQKTFLFNLFLMIGLPFIIPGIPINFSNGQHHLAYMNSALLVVYIAGLYFNIKQKHLWMRQVVAVLATMVSMTGPVFFRNGTEYNMLINLMSAVILFDNLSFVIFSLFIIACVTYVRMRDVDPATITAFSKASPYINIFWSQFLYVFCVWSFKYIYSKYQKQLAIAYERLKVLNETKDKILRVVAHDLRTPLSGISAISQILIDEKHNGDNRPYLQMISNASAQSLTLINDLLNDHGNDTGQITMTSIDINVLVSHVFELMQYKAAEKQQLLKLSMEDINLPVYGDAEKLSRVFQNLVSNAIKFTPVRGEILLHVKKLERSVEVSVKDNGIGIPLSLQDQLFSMSSQIKREGTQGEKSFGLGLSLAKQLIQAHDGRILVESAEGKGTTMRVQLPVSIHLNN